MELVYRFAACFAPEFRAAAASQGVEKANTKELLDYMLQQRFEVDCIDKGKTRPAQICFEPTTLFEVLQVGISLSISESSAGDLIAVLKRHVTSDGPLAESNDTIKKFNELSVLILEGGKGSVHQDAMNSFLSLYPTVVDLLETSVPIVDQVGNSETIPLADILAIYRRLQPRFYSMSSSSITSPTIVEISVVVVHAHTNDGVHIAGVCSNYLARLKPMHDRACISIRASSFRVPDDIVNTSMIMVGAGTGLAPMIGFLEVSVVICMTGIRVMIW
jgi:sulfite reductase alpha subunit-like flavoprotein